MKRPSIKVISLILIVFLTLSTAGCWDKVEINDRVFVTAMTVDKFDYQEVLEKKERKEQKEQEAFEKGEEPPEEKSMIDMPPHSRWQRIILTIGYPNVGLLTGKGGLIPEEMKVILSTTGPNILELITMLTTRLNKDISFSHMKVILIGEELARDEKLFEEVLDGLERDHEISRIVNFAITEGKAKDVLYMKPVVEPIVGTYIEQVFQRREVTARFLGRRLGDVLIYLRQTGDALIPRVVKGEEELKVAGSCIIKDYKMVGFLGELETRAVQLMDNMVRGGVYSVFMDDVSIPFKITSTNRQLKISADKEDNIYLDIDIEVEGDIAGYKSKPLEDVMDDKFIKKVEKKISEKIVAECSGIMDKMQGKFGVDLWGIADYIRKFHPDLWDRIKDNWDQVYPDIEVKILPQVNVRRIGIVK